MAKNFSCCIIQLNQFYTNFYKIKILKEHLGLDSQDHHHRDIAVHLEETQQVVVVNKTKQQVPYYEWAFHLQEDPFHRFHMDLLPIPPLPWEW